ncbi:putative DNA binding domain-containing protein [Fructilactobacillus cliffordii]|uniref:RNA-binding domain-containing protein n=1 Tax=Fructilactobacillus cliffordii TaxID=2940299 RepID=UPI002092B43D|nr:RNA-binding domain-containing protein [Fructilactobacillus cliffordii]USS85995.1 putative DNA binding domain-containing protein [Fructilactobacillus cliffordii]
MKKKFKDLSKENHQIEYKKCEKKFPKEAWESIASFENTDGGTIYLGIDENKEFINGISNNVVQKIHEQFWDGINNGVLSYSTIKNDDIKDIQCENGRTVIKISVRKSTHHRPVFYKGNAYIRKGPNDYKISLEEALTIKRDNDLNLDRKLMRGTSISDLNMEDIDRYRSKLFEDPIQQERLGKLPLNVFLQRLNVIDYDENENLFVTLGGLLFFGKTNVIIKHIPHFQLDYFDKSNPLHERYSNRISSIVYDFNIYSFYNNVISELYSGVKNRFSISEKNGERIETGSTMRKALREALINTLMHADYEQSGYIRITVTPENYLFENPGTLLITPEQFFNEIKTKVRNPIISSLFVKIGLGEREGYGGETIQNAATMNKLKSPEIYSSDNITHLKIWSIDFLTSLDNKSINDYEKNIIKVILKSEPIPISRKKIQDVTKLSYSITNRNLSSLIDKKIIDKVGNGRGTKYSMKNSSKTLMRQMQAFPDILREIIKKEGDNFHLS